MTDDEKILSMLANLLVQWTADIDKRASIPALTQYNMYVALSNAMHTAGAVDAGIGADNFLSLADGWLTIVGYDDIHDIMTAHSEDWDGAWPVPFAS